MKRIRSINIFFAAIALSLLSFSGAKAEVAPVFYGDEVVVTASRIPQLRSELPASATVITSAEIGTFGAKNMGDVLDLTFGTYSNATGYLGSQVSGSIRGFSYQQMLVLIDGQRINSPLLGGYDLGDLPVDDVEKVEIVRGPASALYGADAVGGVINIITRSQIKNNDKYSLTACSELSEKGAYDLKMSASGMADSFNYSFSAKQASSPGYRENGDYLAQNYTFNILKDLGDGSNIRFAGDLYHANKGVPGSLTFPTPSTRQEDNDQHFRILSMAKMNDWWTMNINSSFDQMEQLYSADPSSMPYDRYASYSSKYEIQNDLQLGDIDLFNFGVEYRNDMSRSVLSGTHLVTNKAAFAQDQLFFSKDLSLTIGARIDEHSIYGDTSSPRAGLLYRLSNDSSVWFSYGEAYRAPTLNDLYTYYVDPVWGMIMKGNLSLKPESSKDTEIGYRSKINDRTEINADYFTSRVENLIQWVDVSGDWMTWEAQNVASANISGYEIGLTYFLSADIKCFVNYSALDAKDGSSGKDLPYRPQAKYSAGLEYNDLANNSAGILIDHVGERYDDSSNRRKVDPYTVTNVDLHLQISPKWGLSFGAANFFNAEYQETFNYPMPGRIYTFGMQYDLI